MNQTIRGVYTPEGLIFGIIESSDETSITIRHPSILTPIENQFTIFPLLHSTVEQTLTIKKDKLMSDYMYEMLPDVEKLFKTVYKIGVGIITPPEQKIIH